jgi:hypothetical protein
MQTRNLMTPARRALGPALFAAALTFIALLGAVAVSEAPHSPPAGAMRADGTVAMALATAAAVSLRA